MTRRYDIFNYGALQVFAALDGVTPEEEAQKLLAEEERLAKEARREEN